METEILIKIQQAVGLQNYPGKKGALFFIKGYQSLAKPWAHGAIGAQSITNF